LVFAVSAWKFGKELEKKWRRAAKEAKFAPSSMKVAIVGATGLVGRTMAAVLSETKFPVGEWIACASEQSLGRELAMGEKATRVVSVEEGLRRRPDVALFSAGGAVSKQWAPVFAREGILVVDNSSAWRMDPDVPLVVPEINLETAKGKKLIANPNCSTIQMVVALEPLRRRYGIERIVVSTYQAVTGTGQKAVEQLRHERSGSPALSVYPHPIDLNVIPHCDVFLDNGYTREEMKLVHETRKIFADPDIGITATAVRVPVMGGHSEAVNVTFKSDFDINEVKALLASAPGVVLYDDPSSARYPMPINSAGKNDVFVGRVRRDESAPRSLNLWIVADNLRKGAATNAVQIARALLA
jgi:aspartate-semialdehyde dehydrogenase